MKFAFTLLNLTTPKDKTIVTTASNPSGITATAKEIAVIVSKQFNVTVDKRKISVDDIKAFGTYNAQVRLHPKVSASFKVQVVEE